MYLSLEIMGLTINQFNQMTELLLKGSNFSNCYKLLKLSPSILYDNKEGRQQKEKLEEIIDNLPISLKIKCKYCGVLKYKEQFRRIRRVKGSIFNKFEPLFTEGKIKYTVCTCIDCSIKIHSKITLRSRNSDNYFKKQLGLTEAPKELIDLKRSITLLKREIKKNGKIN